MGKHEAPTVRRAGRTTLNQSTKNSWIWLLASLGAVVSFLVLWFVVLVVAVGFSQLM